MKRHIRGRNGAACLCALLAGLLLCLSGTGTTAPRNMAELLGIGTYGEDAGRNREETE